MMPEIRCESACTPPERGCKAKREARSQRDTEAHNLRNVKNVLVRWFLVNTSVIDMSYLGES